MHKRTHTGENLRVATSVADLSANHVPWLNTNEFTLVRNLTVATSIRKSFSTSWNLFRRKRIHTGEKAYSYDQSNK